jgi:farnesyl-diphosphate farnesyltransferase
MTDLDRLLLHTSRTFALSIPELPEPTRRAITVAYLLFRIADTFEDATGWTRRQRVDALQTFRTILETPTQVSFEAFLRDLADKPPCGHPGYLELLDEMPSVMASLEALEPGTRAILLHHLARTAEGMAGYVQRGDPDGSLRLRDLEDLRQYCYVVAGIVGELITDTFLLHEPGLVSIESRLRDHARSFGEGLQLVNILRDALDDAREGRVYLPPDVDIATVFELARDDLRRASRYVLALQEAHAPHGYVGFTALPVLLAFATLDRVEEVGAGAKITREEVAVLVQLLHENLQAGRPAVSTDF